MHTNTSPSVNLMKWHRIPWACNVPKRSIFSFITPTLSLGSCAQRFPTSLETKSNLTTRSKTVYMVPIYKIPHWKPWWSHVLFQKYYTESHEHQMLPAAVAFRSKRLKMLVIWGIVKLTEFLHVTSKQSDRFWTCSTVAVPSATPSEATQWLRKRAGTNLVTFLNRTLITWVVL